jgi:hypothetical protein
MNAVSAASHPRDVGYSRLLLIPQVAECGQPLDIPGYLIDFQIHA